jgi:YesN/AraC family two-component response regulator
MYQILLAEDEETPLKWLSTRLDWTEVGCRVARSFENGKETLDFLAEHRVDIVLTDIKMPKASGLDIARSLFEHKRPEKVIFISGYAEFSYAQEALKYNVCDYVLKPMTKEKLFDAVRKAEGQIEEERAHAAAITGGQAQSSPMVSLARLCVEEHYDEPTFNANTLARLCRSSGPYLSRAFKRDLGMSAAEYLSEFRVERARELLSSTNLLVSDVGSKVGIDEPVSFSRVFKRVCGESPSDYARRVRKKEE